MAQEDLVFVGGAVGAHDEVDVALTRLGFKVEWSTSHMATASLPKGISGYCPVWVQLIDASKRETIVRLRPKLSGLKRVGGGQPDPRMGLLVGDLIERSSLSESNPELIKHILEFGTLPRFLDAAVVDGAGWSPPIGVLVTIEIRDEQVAFITEETRQSYLVDASAIEEMDIRPQSKKHGGGYRGFGIGIAGAIEGIAIASMMNSLTTVIEQWVTLSLVGPTGRVLVDIPEVSADSVRRAMRPIGDIVAVQRGVQAAPVPTDLVSAIERLVNLHTAGHLSDEEFSAAKALLLN